MRYERNDEEHLLKSMTMPPAYLQTAWCMASFAQDIGSPYAHLVSFPWEPQLPREWCMDTFWGKRYVEHPEMLLYPILFNFKHGIELYLKAFLNIHCWEVDREHDVNVLFCKLRNTLVTQWKYEQIRDQMVALEGIINQWYFLEDPTNTGERYPESKTMTGINSDTYDQIKKDIGIFWDGAETIFKHSIDEVRAIPIA